MDASAGTLAVTPSWNWWTIAMNWTRGKIVHDLPESVSTEHVEFLVEFKMSCRSQSATQDIPLETSGQQRSCLWFLDKHRRSRVLVQVCQQAADHAGRLTSRAMILVTMDRK